jgi:hypothetical protein
MESDMVWLFAQDGESVRDVTLTVAGGTQQPLRASVRDLETDPSSYEGTAISRVELALVAGSVSGVSPGRKVVFDGLSYEVESFVPGNLINYLTLARYAA